MMERRDLPGLKRLKQQRLTREQCSHMFIRLRCSFLRHHTIGQSDLARVAKRNRAHRPSVETHPCRRRALLCPQMHHHVLCLRSHHARQAMECRLSRRRHRQAECHECHQLCRNLLHQLQACCQNQESSARRPIIFTTTQPWQNGQADSLNEIARKRDGKHQGSETAYGSSR